MNISSPQPLDDRHVTLNGTKLLYFGGCDYLRMSHNKEVRQAALNSLNALPCISSSASRTTTGNHEVYKALEQKLASFTHMEGALLTGAGYLSNLVLSGYLRDHADVLLMDEHSHPSLKDTAQLSGLQTVSYQHCKAQSALSKFKLLPPTHRCFLLSESVFGLDGSVMPTEVFHEILPTKISFLIDDAHGFGILGQNLNLTETASQMRERILIKTLSLAKVVGCHGGAVVGPQEIINTISNTAATWAGHTPLPMHLAHAALKSIELLNQSPVLGIRLKNNIKRMSEILENLNLLNNSPMVSPVVSIQLAPQETEEPLTKAKTTLIDLGIYPSIIRYPAVEQENILRIAISSAHLEEDLEKLESALNHLNEQNGLKRFLHS